MKCSHFSTLIHLLRLCLMLLFTLPSVEANAQKRVHYEYDLSGNRISREQSVSPSSSKRLLTSSLEDNHHYLDGGVGIHLGPNPTRDKLTITFPNNENYEQCLLFLYSVTGQKLYSSKTSKSSTTLDLSQYPDGTYLLRILLNGKSSTYKIIKN